MRYEDRAYSLADLNTVDLFLSYWDGNRDIAHTLISFGFGGTNATLVFKICRFCGVSYRFVDQIWEEIATEESAR